jgi:membrane protein implicated in regulation of membrane protease activity
VRVRTLGGLPCARSHVQIGGVSGLGAGWIGGEPMFGSGFDALSCVYFVLFFIGVGYAIFLVVSGGLSNIDMPNVDIDVPQVNLPGDVQIPGADVHIGGADVPAAVGLDSPDVSVSPLSPITIATFITVFGGLGVITLQFLDIDPRWSLLIATGGALLCSAAMFVFYSRILIGSQSSTQVRGSELIGVEAEVMVPIGETTPGQVSYVTKAGRMSSVARSADGSAIPRGQFVRIVQATGSQVLVQPIALESEPDG